MQRHAHAFDARGLVRNIVIDAGDGSESVAYRTERSAGNVIVRGAGIEQLRVLPSNPELADCTFVANLRLTIKNPACNRLLTGIGTNPLLQVVCDLAPAPKAFASAKSNAAS
jgi:hypothetical protein